MAFPPFAVLSFRFYASPREPSGGRLIQIDDAIFNLYEFGMALRQLAPTLERLATHFPVVAVSGPRQSGKARLALFAEEDPRGFRARYPDGGIARLRYFEADVGENPDSCPVLPVT